MFQQANPVLGIRHVKPRLKDSVQRSKSALEPAFIVRNESNNESHRCSHQYGGHGGQVKFGLSLIKKNTWIVVRPASSGRASWVLLWVASLGTNPLEP